MGGQRRTWKVMEGHRRAWVREGHGRAWKAVRCTWLHGIDPLAGSQDEDGEGGWYKVVEMESREGGEVGVRADAAWAFDV